jgi:subtilisin family serine protease
VKRAATLCVAALAVLLAVPALAAAGTPPQPGWNVDQIHVPEARDAGRSGAGVIVAVLDAWVDAGHKDFEGRVQAGADCVGGTCKDGPASPDTCTHGTHVAGTVASSSFGVAPQAGILPVRVLTYDAGTDTCTGQPDDVAAGIRWAVAHGARVLNLSLGPDVPGLSASTAIASAVEEAARQGVLVVFSAGNASLPMADAYGGDALIVAATGPSGQLASYSQRDTGVDLAAPGGDPQTPDHCTDDDCVTSLYPGDGYAVAAGTSMAAPHVSGIAALLLGADPARTRDELVQRLAETAHPLAGAGHGLVDAAAALGVPAGAASPPASPTPGPVASVPAQRPSPAVSPAPVLPRRGVTATLMPATPSAEPSATQSPAGSPRPTTVPVATAQAPGGGDGLPAPLVAVAAALVLGIGAPVVLIGLRYLTG